MSNALFQPMRPVHDVRRVALALEYLRRQAETESANVSP